MWIAMVGFFVLMNWWMFSRLQNYRVHSKSEEISTAIAAADATSSDILQVAPFFNLILVNNCALFPIDLDQNW